MTHTTVGPYDRTTCACVACVAACERQPGPLAPGDLERIAAYLDEPVGAVARAYFWRSPGALVANRAGQTMRVGTITPKRGPGGCVFLTDGKCRIHPVAPFGCAAFTPCDEHDRGAHSRALWLVMQQMRPEYQALRATVPDVATSWTPGGY